MHKNLMFSTKIQLFKALSQMSYFAEGNVTHVYQHVFIYVLRVSLLFLHVKYNDKMPLKQFEPLPC